MRKIINAHVTQVSYFKYDVRYNMVSDSHPEYNATLAHSGRWGTKAIINWRTRRYINKYNRAEEVEANRVINKWEITP